MPRPAVASETSDERFDWCAWRSWTDGAGAEEYIIDASGLDRCGRAKPAARQDRAAIEIRNIESLSLTGQVDGGALGIRTHVTEKTLVDLCLRALLLQSLATLSNLSSNSTPNLSLHEPVGEAVGLALDRRLEHLGRVRILLLREQVALRVEYEARSLHLLADDGRVDTVQRLSIVCP